jgi:oligopeptide transport system substrate-binding protein
MKDLVLVGLLSISNISFGVPLSMKPKSSDVVYFCSNKIGNPWFENASYDCWSSFMTAVLGTLVSLDNNAELKPALLESYDWDFKKNYYILKLKEGLVFHNGRRVTAEDLEFSILRSFFAGDPNNEGSLALSNLIGVDKIKHGQPYCSGLVEGVKILDNRSIALSPSTYSPSFLHNLARAHYSLVPREEYQDDLMTWKKWPIGAGAYKVTGEDKESRAYQLTLVDEKGFPKAPKSIFYEQERIFEPDITSKDSISAKSSKYKQEELSFSFLQRNINFNYSSSLGKDRDFRKAVSLAISRDEISKTTNMRTKPLYETITSGNIGRIHVKENYDLKEATQLFRKVLGTNSSKVFKIPYSPDDSFLGQEYKNVIKSQLGKAGLQIEFHEGKNLWEPYTDEFSNSPFSLDSLMVDSIDSTSTFVGYAKSGGASNSVYFPEIEIFGGLIDKARSSANRKSLHENLKNLSSYFNENIVMIPLIEMTSIAYYKPEKIASLGSQFGETIFYLHNLKMRED